MVWHAGAEVEAPDDELSISWGPASQALTVGRQQYVHDGQPSVLSSSGVARLLLAACSQKAPWRPVGDAEDVRRAEFNTSVIEMLLDLILLHTTDGMPAESIIPQIVRSSDTIVSLLTPFPTSARDAVAALLGDINDEALGRLAPLFYERRKIDRRGMDPQTSVSFKFRKDQTFDVAPELAVQLRAQLAELRATAGAPKTPAELTAGELIIRAWGQPDLAVARIARDEIFARLHRMDGGGQPPVAALKEMEQMASLATQMYYLIKPACRICGLPATHMLHLDRNQADYRCDSHPIPMPQFGTRPDVEELRNAPIIRAGALLARQSAAAAPVGMLAT